LKKGDLILQAQKPGDAQILQLIPRSNLLDDFPRHFVDEYVHWLNLSTGELEFRPAGSPWGPSIWRLCFDNRRAQDKINMSSFHFRDAILQKQCQDNCESPIRIIDIRSTTFDVVSRLVSSLESPEHITVTVVYTTQTLEVSLPRLRLSFFVNTNGELECRSLPGLIIDKSQSCGTLFGLRSKLVLRPTRRGSSSKLEGSQSVPSRRVIIPQGDISFRTIEGFTDVFINTDAQKHVHWHEYTIDIDLGCLTNNSSLGSRLYQCYLHALTSHCLPDPLLSHTGTEEALYILRSAACRSFQKLDVHEETLLKLVRDLSPHRTFSRQSMVKIMWNDLPVLSQHHDFSPLVCSLLGHARALEALYDLPASLDTADYDQSSLNWVPFHHTSSYYPSELHISEQSLSFDDVEYRPGEVPNVETAENVFFRESAAVSYTKGISPRTSSESLKALINELLDSPKPLLQLYGNELNKSHCELLRQDAHRCTQGVVPSHEVLLLYHEECSRRKDKIYSNISAALAPSQNVEEISHIAGLWPRITPRSILRQLAHDRICTLPNHWKSIIMFYAISFLRYQQSLRLIELVSRQRYEDLFREIEAVRHDILAGSTPDWLLIQVRQMPC
jgi:hypothetical protein